MQGYTYPDPGLLPMQNKKTLEETGQDIGLLPKPPPTPWHKRPTTDGKMIDKEGAAKIIAETPEVPWHKRPTTSGEWIDKEDAGRILNKSAADEDARKKPFVGEIDIREKPKKKGVRDLINDTKKAEAPAREPVIPTFEDKEEDPKDPPKKIVGGKPTRKVTNKGASRTTNRSFDYSSIDEARALRSKAGSIEGTMAKSAYEGDIGGHIERGRSVKSLRDAALRAEAEGVRVKSVGSKSEGPSSAVDNDRSAMKLVDSPAYKTKKVPDQPPGPPEPEKPDFESVDYDNLPAPPKPNIIRNFTGQGRFGNMA